MKFINGVACRTKRESLLHIIAQAEAGTISAKDKRDARFGQCAYVYPSGNNCAVGSLFSKEQLKDIERLELNEMSIDYVADKIGEKNIEAVTGMTMFELESLQKTHDEVLQNSGFEKARQAVIHHAKDMLQALKK